MNVRELKALLADVPDDLVVYVETYEHRLMDDHLRAPVVRLGSEFDDMPPDVLVLYASTAPEDCPHGPCERCQSEDF